MKESMWKAQELKPNARACLSMCCPLPTYFCTCLSDLFSPLRRHRHPLPHGMPRLQTKTPTLFMDHNFPLSLDVSGVSSVCALPQKPHQPRALEQMLCFKHRDTRRTHVIRRPCTTCLLLLWLKTKCLPSNRHTKVVPHVVAFVTCDMCCALGLLCFYFHTVFCLYCRACDYNLRNMGQLHERECLQHLAVQHCSQCGFLLRFANNCPQGFGSGLDLRPQGLGIGLCSKGHHELT